MYNKDTRRYEMRTLSEFIKESTIGLSEYIKQQLVCEAYDQCAKSWDDLVNFIKTKRNYSDDLLAAIYELIKQIIDGDRFYAVYDKGQSVFKISRCYVNNVDTLLKKPITIKTESGAKFTFSCKPGGGTDRSIYCEGSNMKSQLIFELGTGSIGKIKTEEQEQATVSIWNYLVDHDFNILKQKNAHQIIEAQVTDLTDGIKGDPSWIKSCVSQIEQIEKFLTEKRGIKSDYVKNFRAIRYGYKDPKNKTNVAQAHKEFLDKYLNLVKDVNKFENIQKDNYDPSDILIYDSTKGDAIAGVFLKLADVSLTDVSKVFDTYKELFRDNLLFGISLKKISHNPSFELFNIDRTGESINKYVCSIDSVSKCDMTGNKNGAYAIVEGKFKFEGIADPKTTQNDNNEPQELKTKTLRVSIRTFGSGTIGLDIAETKGPALGKVPVNIWRKELNVNKQSDLETCIKSFMSVFGDMNGKLIEKENKTNKERAEEVIVGGVKNGPWCLPFVLVH